MMEIKILKCVLFAGVLAAGLSSCGKGKEEIFEDMPWDAQPMSIYLYMGQGWNVDSSFIDKVDFDNFDCVYLMDGDKLHTTEAFEPVFDSISGGKEYPISHPHLFRYAVDKAHEAGTKAILTLGSDVSYGACDSLRRPVLVGSLAKTVEDLDADGIDIDWEQRLAGNLEAHTALLEGLRSKLDSLGEAKGRKYYVTTALGIGARYYPETLRARLGEAVDWVNMMAYDVGGGVWGRKASHNTPLKVFSDSIDNNWKSIPRRKLHLGLASYGFIYHDLLPEEQLADDRYMAEYGSYIDYNAVVPLIYNSRNWHAEYDSIEQVNYFFNDKAREFITCETPETIRKKFQLAADKGLGGTFWWEYQKDIVPDPNGGDKWVHTLIPKHRRVTDF